MRHRKRRTKLGMMTAHRKAMLRNMVRSLLKYQKITTTLRRAKEARRLAEHVITLGRSDNIASRRRAYSVLTDRDLVTKLFKEIAPLFKDRSSGFTRIISLGFRRGDGASLAILELTEKKIVEKKPKKKKEEKSKVEEKQKEDHRPKTIDQEEKKEAKKEEPKAKTIAKAKPTLEEEKRAEKAKSEDKKITDKKNFMKNLRGFFRRKTDM